MPKAKKPLRGANGGGSIREKTCQKNGKTYTYYEGRYTCGIDPATGKQCQKSVSAKTRTEVADLLCKAMYEAKIGNCAPQATVTIEEWANRWLTTYLGDIKSGTKHLYEQTVKSYIIPCLGKLQVKKLKRDLVQKFINKLSESKENGGYGLSPKTVKNVHGVLHGMMEQAMLNGYIVTNPVYKCKLPKVVKEEFHPLEEEQIEALLEAIKGHRYEFLYKIALFTGMRQGELLGLTWKNVNLADGSITISQQLRRDQKAGGTYYISTPKNGKTRVIAIPPSVVKLFEEQRKLQEEYQRKAADMWIDRGLVFTNEIGDYLYRGTVYDCLKRIVNKLNFNNFRFHDLRHTYAVLCIKNGDDVKTVQENLGHATPEFTLAVYAHVTRQMKRVGADHMEQYMQTIKAS